MSKMAMEGETTAAAECVDVVVVVVVEGVVVDGVVPVVDVPPDVPPAAATTLTASFIPSPQCPAVAQVK